MIGRIDGKEVATQDFIGLRRHLLLLWCEVLRSLVEQLGIFLFCQRTGWIVGESLIVLEHCHHLRVPGHEPDRFAGRQRDAGHRSFLTHCRVDRECSLLELRAEHRRARFLLHFDHSSCDVVRLVVQDQTHQGWVTPRLRLRHNRRL